MATLQVGERWIDLESGATSEGTQVKPAELRLLRYLADHLERVIPIDELHTQVWGYHPNVSSRSAYTSINRLRALLEPDPGTPRFLLSSRGAYSLQGAAVAPSATPARRGFLPQPSTNLVGREELVRRLTTSIPRLRVLTGVGGCGKSRVALEVARARSLPGGAWWVDVCGAGSVDEVIDRVERVVGEPLGAAPCLVVLDGADALPGSEALSEWLAEAPAVHWLVTTRLPVPLRGAEVESVGALPAADARRLFEERAGTFSALSHAQQSALLTATDGLPLAIEIAASHLDRLGAEVVVASLSALTTAADPRRRSLEGLIGWSLAHLPREPADALAALAAIDGTVCVEAALAVIGAPSAASSLAELLEIGLVELNRRRTPHVRVMTSVRALAPRDPSGVERLLRWVHGTATDPVDDPWAEPAASTALSPEAAAQLLAHSAERGPGHARTVLALLGAAGAAGSRSAHRAVDAALRGELDPALEFHLRRWQLGVQVAPSLGARAKLLDAADRSGDDRLRVLARLKPDDGSLSEAEALARQLDLVSEARAQIRIRRQRFTAAARAGAADEAEHHAREGLRHALAGVCPPEDVCLARGSVMELATLAGEIEEAERHATEILAASRSPELRATAHVALAWVAYMRRDGDLQLRHASAAMESSREANSAVSHLAMLRNLGWLLFMAGREEGPVWLGECLDLEPATAQGEAWRAWYRSSRVAASAGPAAALADAARAVSLAREQGGSWVANLVAWQAELVGGVGDPAGAADLLATAGWAVHEVPLHVLRAELLLRTGAWEEALALAVRASDAPGLPVNRARAHAVIAVIAAGRGDFAAAARRLARAGGVRGPGDWWVDMHTELVRAWSEGRPPVAPALDVPPFRFAARWALSDLAVRTWSSREG